MRCPIDPKHGEMEKALFTREVERKSGSSTCKVIIDDLPGYQCSVCRLSGRDTRHVGNAEEKKYQKLVIESLYSLIERSHRALSFAPPHIILRYGDNPIQRREGLFILSEPDVPKSRLVLSPDTHEQFHTFLVQLANRDKLYHEWNLKSVFSGSPSAALFHGAPGTGKTLAARVIATAVGKPLMEVNYANLESKFVGDTPKNVKKVLQSAKEKDCLLLLDEADSLLSKRVTELRQAADYGVNLTRSVLLMELENSDLTIVFTTNLIENVDKAFERRIGFYVKFDLPGIQERRLIWTLHLPQELPVDSSVSTSWLAEESSGMSGGDIQNAVLRAATTALARQANRDVVEIGQKDFIAGIKTIKEAGKTSSTSRTLAEKRGEIEIDPIELKEFIEHKRRQTSIE